MQTDPLNELNNKLQNFIKRAPLMAGRYAVNHFRDNIRKRGGVPVNGSLQKFKAREIDEPGAKRTTLLKSGNMVDSIRITMVTNKMVVVGIDQPSIRKYAKLHQQGGTIKVTTKMKKYFWAMFYKSSGSVRETKAGKISKSKGNLRYSAYADFWKAMALKKTGSKITIKKREFMKVTPDLHKGINREFQYEIKTILNSLK